MQSLQDLMRRSDFHSRRMKTKSGGGAGKAHERLCGMTVCGSLTMDQPLFWEITIRSDNMIGEMVAKADGDEWF